MNLHSLWHQLNHFDQTLLVIVLFFGLCGLFRGMFTAFLSCLFCLASFAAALIFLSKLANYYSSFGFKAYSANLSAFLTLFILGLIIGALINMIFSAILPGLGKGFFGRLLGILVGFAHGILLAIVIAFVIYNSSWHETKWYQEAKSYPELNTWAEFIQNNWSSQKDWQHVTGKHSTSHTITASS